MSKNIYLIILKTGIYLSLLSVFLVYNKFLFPYITSKQIYFNVLIEILLIFWVAFVFKYPEYRPKKNWISLGLISFFAVILLSSFTGVDFNLSFWGDIERMLGFFHILHFLAFYFIITVMRDWRDWKLFFILSLVCALLVSVYGLKGHAFSTIGNTAYVSGYLIFNIYFALILFSRSIQGVKFKLTRDWFINFLPSLLYLLPIPVMLAAFKRADTSGAYVGFSISIFALLFLFGMFAQSKKVKTYTFGSFLILILAVSFLFFNRNSDFLQGTHIGNVIKQISVEKNTFQTRLISWRAALYDFKKHPILGEGYGNYAITFDKYFDPTFYNYTRSETYFDRAHNNLIDIISTTGILGLLTYLSIFIALAYYLFQGLNNRKISLYDFALISSLIIAYFIQNLAVFDSLPTYILLMMTLGFVYFKLNEVAQKEERKDEATKEIYTTLFVFSFFILIIAFRYLNGVLNKNFSNANHLLIYTLFFVIFAAILGFVYYKILDSEDIAQEIKKTDNKKDFYILGGLGLIMLVLIYQYNIKPVKMLEGTILGQVAFAKGSALEGVEAYKKALIYNTGLDRDSRASFVRSVLSRQNLLYALDKKEAKEIVDYAISLAELNLAYNPQDSLMQMQLAQVLSIAVNFAHNKNGMISYLERAHKAIDESIKSSPGRIRLYYVKAQLHLTTGDIDSALKVLNYAVSLNKDYYDSYCHLSRVYANTGSIQESYATADKCVDLGGASLLQGSFVKQLIEHYSATSSIENNTQRLISLFERLSKLEQRNAQVFINLAQLYAKENNNKQAIKAAEKAAAIDVSLRSSVDRFVNTLKAKE